MATRLKRRGCAAISAVTLSLTHTLTHTLTLTLALILTLTPNPNQVSLWLGEQFASDLHLAFPRLSIEVVSANKLLGQLGQGFPTPQAPRL